MASIYKNEQFNGDAFEIFTDAHKIERLENTRDGQQVFKITQYSESNNPNDTKFNKPISEAIVTGKDIEYIKKPNGEYESEGFDIHFKSGTFSEVTVNDFVGSTRTKLGEPREVFSFKGEGDETPNAKMLNRPSEKIEKRLEAKADGETKEEFETKPATVEKNDGFGKDDFGMFEKAHSIKDLGKNDNGEQVLEVTQNDAHGQPSLKAVITGKDISYTTKELNDGVDIDFTGGTFSTMTIDDFDGASGASREVYKFDGNGEVEQSTGLLNKSALRIENKLDRYGNNGNDEGGGNTPPPSSDAIKIYDTKGETDYVQGTDAREAFVIDGKSNDYNWGKTDNGGYVVWNEQGHDILYDVEELQFKDKSVSLDEKPNNNENTSGKNLINDVAKEVQYIMGTDKQDAFVIDGKAADYDWSKTDDGGYVVWNEQGHDILYDVEELHFNDQQVKLNDQDYMA